MTQRRVFVDMDGVLADFGLALADSVWALNEFKKMPGTYAQLNPMHGAIEGVRDLITQGLDVWIATKPPTDATHAYTEKADWIYRWLPELKRKIIITHDKGLLGGENDFLIDDRPHKANCRAFKGNLIHFGSGDTCNWTDVVKRINDITNPVPRVQGRLLKCPDDTGQHVSLLGPTCIREDNCCSYCGALDPDLLMERIEQGTIILEGSDKSYKCYLKAVHGSEPLKQSYRVDKGGTSDVSKWIWTTRETDTGKFYFTHLSEEQRARFVELFSQQKIKHSLYVMPFFMRAAE